MSGFDPIAPDPAPEDVAVVPGLGPTGSGSYPCDECSRPYGVAFVETPTGPVPLCPRCRKVREQL